jgi:hypothetical protein
VDTPVVVGGGCATNSLPHTHTDGVHVVHLSKASHNVRNQFEVLEAFGCSLPIKMKGFIGESGGWGWCGRG